MSNVRRFRHLLFLIVLLTIALLPVQTRATVSGTAVAWGYDAYGQATVPAGLTNVTAVAAGFLHSLALKADGTVVAWGDNTYGQTSVPAGLTGVTGISAGGLHSLALKSDGTVAAWGVDFSGTVTGVMGLTGVTAVSAGTYHSVMLKGDGTVVVFGDNTYGQTDVPAGLTGVIAISAGFGHTLALKADGTVVAWGQNGSNQAAVPAGLTGVVAISAGGQHSIALKADGTVVAWGSNVYGQATIPSGLTGVTAIYAGYYHNIAQKADGTIVLWGDNTFGESTVPAGLTGVIAFSGGYAHTIVVTSSNQAPIAHDDVVTAVKNTALIIPVLANDINPEDDPLVVQSTTPAGHGNVTINSDGTITYHPTGNYLGADTFTYTIRNGKGGTSTATVYVNVALQTSVLVTNASCVGTGSVALYARLVQGTTAGKNNLIAGQPLLFLVNGTPVGTGTTDAYGKAYVNYLPVVAGSFLITVQFLGSGTYAPSEGTGTLIVTPSATEITLQPTGGQTGGGTTITGRLARTSINKGLAGVSVTISVDGTLVGTVTTGTDGYFTCPYSIPAGATSGAHTVTASFAGNALNSPSTGSATLTVAP